MALVHGYADGMMTINESIIDAVISSRNKSTLFSNNHVQETSTPASTPEQQSSLTTPDIADLRNCISVLEDMFNSLRMQTQKQFAACKTRDKFTLELLFTLQESLKTPQKIPMRYQKLYNTIKKHLSNRNQ